MILHGHKLADAFKGLCDRRYTLLYPLFQAILIIPFLHKVLNFLHCHHGTDGFYTSLPSRLSN